jgi:hypothetical protein
MHRRRSGSPIGGNDACPRPVLARPSARIANERAYNYRDGPQNQLLPFGRLSSFGSRLFIGQNEIYVTNTQRAGELKQRYDGRVTVAALQITDVLLGKAGHFGELLLREALLLPQSCEIPTD